MADERKAAVVIDYQNVHMTTAEVFMRGQEPYHALIDPCKFSNRLVPIKNENVLSNNVAACSDEPLLKLSRVEVYRGLPSPKVDQSGYSRNLKQKSNWEKEAFLQGLKLRVRHRPLKYQYHYANNE
ncbi:hypothetical protein [Bifidobacterium aemilianum]|uniref:hypothetical protein n=1 Tax=Bifidobacterium aemilianum TaxID=2493120 RepID=UPI001F2C689A|nr:hypothetical protein [Bifidobacterium aemilianum]